MNSGGSNREKKKIQNIYRKHPFFDPPFVIPVLEIPRGTTRILARSAPVKLWADYKQGLRSDDDVEMKSILEFEDKRERYIYKYRS